MSEETIKIKFLSKKKFKKYVDSGCSECPMCGCDQIEGGDINVDSGTCSQEMYCTECDAEWYDVYKIVSVQIGG